MKYPWLQFFTGDWMKDPALSRCTPATRGIWMDLLCAMHESDRSGVITGTCEQLARLGRCSAVELDQALADLKATGAADVTVRNDLVTVANRRMKREAKARNGSKLRMQRMRSNEPVTHPVTPYISEVRNQKSESERALSARAREEIVQNPSWKDFWDYCRSPDCELTAEWFARDKWEAANAENWKRLPNWQAYARRCKGWWEADGRPLARPAKVWNGKPQLVPDHDKGF
jgi:hypothetical protein